MAKETEGSQCWIDRELGRGSYGNVYLLTCSESPHGAHSKYALKVVDEHGLSSRDQEATVKELRIMRGLYHPNIVTLVDSFQVLHRLLLVLELCEEGDLRNYLDCLKKRRRTSNMGVMESLVVQWTLQLTDGLQYLHHKKILHRDLKPQNIFLKDQFSIKIGDLGIARQLVFTKEMAATHIGTPLYISPEIYQGNSYSYKTDVWSLGCCVYEMMTLQYAFHAPSRFELVGKVVNKQVLPVPESYSCTLRNLVLCMLCKDPEERPHAKQLLEALRELHAEQSQPRRPGVRKEDTTLNRSERPKDARSLQIWRLRTAEALTQFLSERQAVQCAQITAVLAQKLTEGSAQDISSSTDDPAPSSRKGRRRLASRLTSSETAHEDVDGEGTVQPLSQSGNSDVTLTQSDYSDMTLSSDNMQTQESNCSAVESTVSDSQSHSGARHAGAVHGIGHQSQTPSARQLKQSRPDRNSEAYEDDNLAENSENEYSDVPSRTVVPPRRLKIGKSSMLVRARPLPQPKMYKEQANIGDDSPELSTPMDPGSHGSVSSSTESQTTERKVSSSKPQVDSSQCQPTDHPPTDDWKNEAYAKEVLHWARVRLLPTPSQNTQTTDSHDDSRHTTSRKTLGKDTGPAVSSAKSKPAKKQGRLRNRTAQEGVDDMVRDSHTGVTNAVRKKAGDQHATVKETGVRAEESGKGATVGDKDSKERDGAALGADITAQVAVGVDKARKKKRNFLRDRKAREGQRGVAEDQKGQAADDPRVVDRGISGDAQQTDQPAVKQQKEQGVRLFTRAQRVTFMSLNKDDMDLSIGGESDLREGRMVREVGEARLRAAVCTAFLLPHNPAMLELQLREMLGREDYKKYAATIVKMANNSVPSV